MIKKSLYLLFVIIFVPFVVSENDIPDLDSEQMLLVHKTPTCGCCKMWMKHVEENGFTAYGQDHQNLMKIKEKYNIEPQYRSCHTAVSSDGFIFEGHIPSKFIKQFFQKIIQKLLDYQFQACLLGLLAWKLKIVLCLMMCSSFLKMARVRFMRK